ncbi:MAG: hypothetical protein ACM3QU_01180 [Verrucomicrobiota bacterium]
MFRRGRAVLLVAAVAALCAWPAAGAGAGGAVKARPVTIVFTGKGGGRYLDHTRYLHEATRECYASRLADETLSVRWRIEWTATLVPGARGYVLRAPARRTDAIAGSVDGTSVQDNCDSAEEEPGWAGTSACSADLELHTNGALAATRTAGGLRLDLTGPRYRSPGHPCELDIRNDQLVTAVSLDQALLSRLASGRAVAIPVGTRHPAPGITYLATRNCSHFPHLYDGVEYLYDCDDTLIWNGAVSIRPA